MTTDAAGALPDLEHPVAGAAGAYAAGDEPGTALVVPQRLRLPLDSTGLPALRLQIVRPFGAEDPNAGFGVLDLQLVADADLDAALAAWRNVEPAGSVRLAPLGGGRVLLTMPSGGSAAATAALTVPDSGLDASRLVLRLSLDQAELLADGIEAARAPLQVSARLLLRAVSRRNARSVSFDPAALVAFATSGKPGTAVTSGDLADRLASTDAPVQWSPPLSGEDRSEAAGALADRVLARWATVGDAGDGTLGLLLHAVDPGSFTWKLDDDIVTLRFVDLVLDDLLRDVAPELRSALVVRTSPPPLDVGLRAIEVHDNLVRPLGNVVRIAATVYAAPAPPFRPAAVDTAADLTSGGATVTVRVSPGEDAPLTVTGHLTAIVAESAVRFDGEAAPVDAPLVTLQPTAFGAQLATVRADDGLLALGDVTLDARGAGDTEAAVGARVTATAPAVTLPMPPDKPAELRISATAHDGTKTVELPPRPFATTRVALADFPAYGPQQATLTCDVHDGQVVAVDVCPEGDPAHVTLIFFTADQPTRRYTYLSTSPFAGGFLWRPHADGGAPPPPWSPPNDPAQPLAVPATVAAPTT